MPSLNWIGKDAVLNHHRDVPYRLLKCEGDLSNGDPGSGNLLIEGDNLEALKALLPYYKGKVKCIYIDPPYNTGEESWSYNDNVNDPRIRKWLGQLVDVDTLDRHDRWACMIWPRLSLLHAFLSDDGLIFVSIDDNEVAHLRLIMDAIFKPANFVADMIWQRRTSPDSRVALSTAHDHILVYARNKRAGQLNRIPLGGMRTKDYKNLDSDPRGDWASVDLTGQIGHATPEQFKPLRTLDGREISPPRNRCWAISQLEFTALEKDKRIWWGVKGTARPRRKKFLFEAELMSSWTWLPNAEVGHNQEATKELDEVLHDLSGFDMNPKPTRLLRRLLSIGAHSNSLILDSFAGSGTTAHAIQLLNEQGGDRRFLLIEMIPDVARSVTAKRLERIGAHFRYCTLGETLFTADGMISGEVTRERLAHHVWFTETGEPLPHAVPESPLIGEHNGKAIALIEGPLTVRSLRDLPPAPNGMIVYADACRVDAERLASLGIVFKAIPYDVRDA